MSQLNTTLDKPVSIEPPCGIHENISFDEYKSWAAMNKSTLQNGLLSMAHLHEAMTRGTEEASKAFDFGHALHTAILEPDILDDTVASVKKVDRRTKAGKEQWAQYETDHAGKILLNEWDYKQMLDMTDQVYKHPDIGPMLRSGKGMKEVALVWRDPDFDVLMKMRVDFAIMWEGKIIMPDIKTTISAHCHAFARSMAKFGYDMQSAFGVDAIAALLDKDAEFRFIACEKTRPYVVASYTVGPKTIESGRLKYKNLLRQYVQCLDTRIWPGYPSQVIDIPAWSMVNEADIEEENATQSQSQAA